MLIDSQARIDAVKALCLLDSPPETAFDDVVQLAATICNAPISLITVLDGERQWFKARRGLDVTETPQDQAFCAHAIIQPELFVVPDASKDERFDENPLVTGAPNIRFYAGMPLKTPDGHALGTLCVIDTVPRELTTEQKASLELLSRQVETHISLRAHVKGLNDALVETVRFHEQVIGSNALFQAFMDNSPMAGYMKDRAGHLIYYNEHFAQRFAINRQEWIGKDDFAIWPPEFASAYRAIDLSVLDGGKLVVNEDKSPGPNGTTLFWRSYKFPFDDSSGERLLAGLSIDVSLEKNAENALRKSHEELHNANERLRALTVTDALTGVANRRGFDDRLQREFKISIRYHSDFSLLLLDIDNFKSFNDSFGHNAGDEVLKQVADLLLQGARVSDLVCRYGGEEFAILLPHTGLEAAVVLGQRICRSIADAVWERRGITVSVGAATMAPDLPDATTLIRRSDIALYQAKADGKNRVACYGAVVDPAPVAGH